MFYVTLESARLVRMPEFLQDYVEQHDRYTIVKTSPVIIGCEQYSDVAGLVSAVSRSEMPVTEIQVSGKQGSTAQRLLDLASAN